MKTKDFVWISLTVLSLFTSTSATHAEQEDAVTDWNANAGKPGSVGCNIQPHESRMHAMMHIAIHDALNAIERRFQPYILDLPETPDASVEAAVATAARDVLVPVFVAAFGIALICLIFGWRTVFSSSAKPSMEEASSQAK